MHIDIWSDVVCPWCYLGASRLNAALDELAWSDEIDVRWRAFQLDPDSPKEPQDLRAVLEKKYGAGAFDSMAQRLTQLGEVEGIDYRFDLTQRVNTFDAHRAVAWARSIGPAEQDRAVLALFKAYFTEGRNLADVPTVVAIMASAGLDGEAAATALAGDAFASDVHADIAEARRLGVSGVPAFVVEGRWLISGAQEVATIVDALTGMRADLVGA